MEEISMSQLQKLVKQGIPVVRAEFKLAVNNSDKVPENFFDEESAHKSRQIKMFWTPIGLLCEHKKKWFVVPSDNVKFANLK